MEPQILAGIVKHNIFTPRDSVNKMISKYRLLFLLLSEANSFESSRKQNTI